MITDLRLQNFRSYTDETFEFQPGVNIIVGPNASGKTNLLEAILVLARGSSYRVKDIELLQFEADWARLDAHLPEGTRTVKITGSPALKKIYEINEKTYKRLGLAQTLPLVLFEPNHLQMLSGSPERRRSYLDELLEQTMPGFGTTRRQYLRALAQRNSLLKQNHSNLQTLLFPWNVRLSQLGGHITKARSELIARLKKDFNNLYAQLSHSKTILNLEYLTKLNTNNYESSLLHHLESDIEKDRQRGFTTAGPHREDFMVLLNDRPAGETASRGESRTAVLALKIIELKILETVRGVRPLLLLDDVFSELDGKRRQALTNYLTDYQTFITTTDADLVVQHFTESCHIIPLNN